MFDVGDRLAKSNSINTKITNNDEMLVTFIDVLQRFFELRLFVLSRKHRVDSFEFIFMSDDLYQTDSELVKGRGLSL